MGLRRLGVVTNALIFLFAFGCALGFAFAVPAADAAPAFTPPGLAKKMDNAKLGVTGDTYDHPSLRGLERAYANVVRNGASPRAQEVLKRLIEARSVAEEVYEVEDLTGDEETTREINKDKELRKEALARIFELRAKIKAQWKEQKEQAWAMRKLGLALRKLNDPEAAEAFLREAFKLDSSDEENAEALSRILRLNGDKGLKVFIRGEEVEFDVPPTLINNRTMVPLRKLGESLGADVEWKDGTVVFVQGGRVVVLPVDSLQAEINGKVVTLDTPALIVNGRTLVPLRFISESLCANVKYHPHWNWVTVDKDEDEDEDEDEETEENT